jgi:hypothetical protein
MKKTHMFLIASIAMVMASCSPVKVVTDQDKSVDFSAYKTYNFLGWQDNSDQILSDFDKKRIHDAFKKEFDARGMELVESDGDMAVSLFIVVDQKTSTTAYTDYYVHRYGGYHRYNRGWGQGYATTTFTEEDYLEGTLILDVFDGETKDQVWQGVATGTITEDPQKREKAIPKKIAALMKKYPVPKAD